MFKKDQLFAWTGWIVAVLTIGTTFSTIFYKTGQIDKQLEENKNALIRIEGKIGQDVDKIEKKISERFNRIDTKMDGIQKTIIDVNKDRAQDIKDFFERLDKLRK